MHYKNPQKFGTNSQRGEGEKKFKFEFENSKPKGGSQFFKIPRPVSVSVWMLSSICIIKIRWSGISIGIGFSIGIGMVVSVEHYQLTPIMLFITKA